MLVISVAAKLSGTYQLIKQRIKARELSSDWIRVIDSKLNSVAQGILVKQAVELVESGKSWESIYPEVEQMIERTFIYVAVADLSPMVQSGRIPRVLESLRRNYHSIRL